MAGRSLCLLLMVFAMHSGRTVFATQCEQGGVCGNSMLVTRARSSSSKLVLAEDKERYKIAENQTCAAEYKIEQEDKSTLDDCYDYCFEDVSCTHFTWYAGIGSCRKSSACSEDSMKNTSTIPAAVYAMVAPFNEIAENQTCAVDAKIDQDEKSTLTACYDYCFEDVNCTHFTWYAGVGSCRKSSACGEDSMKYTSTTPSAVYAMSRRSSQSTLAPTQAPTLAPTQAPTLPPTQAPPTQAPQAPTSAPSLAPTLAPSQAPTLAPSQVATYTKIAEDQMCAKADKIIRTDDTDSVNDCYEFCKNTEDCTHFTFFEEANSEGRCRTYSACDALVGTDRESAVYAMLA